MDEALDIEKVKTDTKSIEEMDKMFFDLTERYKVFLNQQGDIFEMVLHIVTHGTYHRGNITAMLRQMGHVSVTTDYTSYWYSDKTV